MGQSQYGKIFPESDMDGGSNELCAEPTYRKRRSSFAVNCAESEVLDLGKSDVRSDCEKPRAETKK